MRSAGALALLPLLHLAFFLVLVSASRPLLLRHDPTFLDPTSSDFLAADSLPTQYMTQPLDHFPSSPIPSPTFQQRYWVNSTHYTPGSPIFLSLGGESSNAASAISGRSGLSFYAAQFSALMVSVEHRFFGQSVPFNDVSTANLRFLTTQQALADTVALIQNLSVALSVPASTPVVVFGGSYAGALSAWLKLSYPEVVRGAIASSAPVRAVVDFAQYLRTVEDALGPECSAVVRDSTALIEAAMSTPAQRAYLQRAFNQCPGLMDEDKDKSMFFNNVLGPITALVQYNTNYRALNISTACALLTSTAQASNGLVALAAFNALYNTADNASYPFATGDACQNTSYSAYIRQHMQENSADRQWYWMTCNEVGFFQTAEGETSAFSTRYLPLSFYSDQCADIFYSTFDLQYNVDATNTRYRSFDLRTNATAFTNGLIDPWHTRGILTAADAAGVDNRVDVIGPTSHCQDLAYPRDTDLPQLQAARFRNLQSISGWLGGPPLGSTGEAGASTGDNGGGGGGSKSMSNGALVGIVVFCMLVAVVAAGVGLWYWKRRRSEGLGSAGGGGSYNESLLTGNSSLLGGDGRDTV